MIVCGWVKTHKTHPSKMPKVGQGLKHSKGLMHTAKAILEPSTA
ncbi:hypothetical protein HHE03_08720 [Helicobacter heilmannii]|nr:hypothetical protein HHE03_08720 [Helicobacter heilmannii]